MEDTIAAVSTPPGSGAIGIIRISGSDALKAGRKLFYNKSLNMKDPKPRYMYFGSVVDPEDGKILDQALFVYMKAPMSATGEDVVELHCHGSMVLLEKIIGIICSDGVRIAQPGEFTKRSFLNGRLDLTQAEAVIDIINAKSEEALNAATGMLGGSLAGEISDLNRNLLEMISDIEASIDFPEEDIEEPSYNHILKDIEDIINRLLALSATFEKINLFKTGIKAAIIGKPNVGKSSLLNRLLGHNRAIVTAVPGTTRDVIEDYTVINDIPFMFIDTAGICNSVNEIEKIGINLTMSKIDEADIIILVLDGTRKLEQDDLKFVDTIRHKNVIIVLNKNDLPCQLTLKHAEEIFSEIPTNTISALKNSGIETLKDKIFDITIRGAKKSFLTSAYVSTLRQKTALEKTAISLQSVIEGIDNRLPLEFIASDLRTALSCLGEITGEVTTEEILDSIFSRFCIGK